MNRSSAVTFGLAMLTAHAVVWASSAALAQPPTIAHALPSAVRPGETTLLTLHGQNLAGASGLWTSFDAASSLAADLPAGGRDAGKVAYRVTVPADAVPGIVGLRVATGGGISNVLLVLIDDLASIADNGQSRSPETAQPITLPAAVDGACDPESCRCYRFAATQGQRLSVEAFARRLASPLDPQIRLLDDAGRELAFSDDEPGLMRDCRFAIVIPADGTYRVEIRDVGYQGGPEFRFRLRLGDFPLLTAPLPLALQKGTSGTLSIAGPGNASAATTVVAMPSDVPDGALRVSAKLPGGTGSAFVTVLASELAEQQEAEPNDEPAQSTEIAVPGGISGRFQQPGDRDCYHFSAQAGQRLALVGHSRRSSSVSELFLRLVGPDGQPIAQSDDARINDGDLTATIPAAGRYRLLVEELNHRGGPEHVYRVEVKPLAPGFLLAADRDRANPPQGGVLAVKVTAARRDCSAPITLSVAGLGEGVTLAGDVIAADAAETTLKITLPSTLGAGSWRQLAIVGSGTLGETIITSPVTTTAALRLGLPALAVVPSGLDQTIGVGVGPIFPPFYQLAIEPPEPALPQIVAASSFKIKVQRLNNFADQIAVAVTGLPPGVEAKVAPIPQGQNEVTVSLAATGRLELGLARLRITTTGIHQDQPQTVVVEPTLRIIKPLVVNLKPAGPIVAGGKQQLKVQLTRFGPEPAPARVVFKNIPAGVTAPAELTIPADKSDVDVELTAAADAPAAKAEGFAAIATTTVQGETISVESPPAILEVGASK